MTEQEMHEGEYTHELKAHPGPFEAMAAGFKTHEIRVDDRTPRYAVGDVLYLREYDPSPRHLKDGGYASGREMRMRVTYITRGPEWGIPEGLVVMSVRPMRPGEAL